MDLKDQLTALIPIVQQLHLNEKAADVEQHVRNLQEYVMDVQGALKADTEQQIQNYLETHIHPLLKQNAHAPEEVRAGIDVYFEQSAKEGLFHHHRRKYENHGIYHKRKNVGFAG